jgi:O-antigen/teichoic acid export membrane protein
MGSTAAVAQIFMLLQSLMLARWFGPGSYAIYVANFNLCTLSVFLVNWGIDTWLLRTASEIENPQKLFGTVILLKVIFGIIWGFLLIFVAPKFKPDLYQPAVLSLAILGTFFESLMNTFYVAFFTTNRFKTSSIILISARTLRLLSTILLIHFSNQNLLTFVTLRVVIDGLILIITWFQIKPIFIFRELINLPKTFSLALPYSGSDFLALVYQQADVNLVSILSSQFDIISFYSLAISAVNMFFAVIQGLLNVVIPYLTRLFIDNKEKLKIYSIFSLAGFSLLGFLFFLLVQYFGQNVIQIILGPNYVNVYTYLNLIKPIFILRSLTFGITGVLIAINKQKQRLIPQAISDIFKVIGSLLVFPYLNIFGVSRIYILSEIVLLCGYCWVICASLFFKNKSHLEAV